MKIISSKLLLLTGLLLICASAFAGGLKGNLFSDELIIGFCITIVAIYILSLISSFRKYKTGKLWLGVIATILTLIIFIPAAALSMYVPQLGIPIAIISGINFILLLKKQQIPT